MNEHESIHYLAISDILAPVGDGLIPHVCGRVDRIIFDDGKAYGVAVDGLDFTAEVVFIKAGTSDTPLLLMRYEISGPAVVTHLTYHPVMIAQVVLDESLRQPTGVAVPPPRLQIPPAPDSPWNVMALRDTSPDPPHPDVANVEENALVELQVFCPIEYRPMNGMQGTEEGIEFDVQLSETERVVMLALEKDADTIVKSLGRYRRGVERTSMDSGFAHLLGACRIGKDASNSVVDSHCRPQGTTSLYLNTFGVTPTPMAVNPTLTGTALTALLVDHFLKRNL
ncbi:MAG: GMC oxidoreductase [Rubripirellula sp.]